MSIGTVLLQIMVQEKFRVIALASRILREAKKNYIVTYLEILVVVWVLKHFIDIIIGYKTTVYTNQSPSIEMFKGRNRSARSDRVVR